MKNFTAALWSERLKMLRSKVPLFTALGFSMVPLVGGLFMVILKDPEAARSMGLISTKAQIAVGTADWTAFFGLIIQAVAAGGMVLFSIITIWVFGREFSDHTVKELLALPTSRETIVTAKFIVIVIWSFVMTLFIFGVGLVVGTLVVIPGWSEELLRASFINVLGAAALTLPLMSLCSVFCKRRDADTCPHLAGLFSRWCWPILRRSWAGVIGFHGQYQQCTAERQGRNPASLNYTVTWL